jgi:hypothetical protein
MFYVLVMIKHVQSGIQKINDLGDFIGIEGELFYHQGGSTMYSR